MVLSCHGCGNELQESDLYCPSCGRPQLRVDLSDIQAVVAEHGVHPPALGIVWRDAIRAALLLAIPMGLLSSFAAAGCLIWIVTGAMTAVALYLRKPRPLPLAANQGARIGMVAGLAAILLAAGSDGLVLVISRYMLGKGQELDSQFVTQVNQAFTQMPQFMPNSPDSQAAMLSLRNFYLSPDGHAILQLGGIASGAIFMLLLSAIGGALGATVFRRRI